MLENLANQVIGKEKEGTGWSFQKQVELHVWEPLTYLSASPWSVCTASWKSEVKKQTVQVPARSPDPDSPRKLRQTCPQSTWTTVSKGILVAPLSCQVGRALAGWVWSLKPPRNIREMQSHEPASEKEGDVCNSLWTQCFQCDPLFRFQKPGGQASRSDLQPRWGKLTVDASSAVNTWVDGTGKTSDFP